MDEVHYLADRARGAVWEEVIIHLPDSVAVVSLSATVSNAEEFGDWLETVRGNTVVVLEEKRPVPLFQHVMVGKRLHDLFAGEAPTARAGGAAQYGPQSPAKKSGNPAKADGAPDLKDMVNPQLVKIARDDSRIFRDDSRKPRRRRDMPKSRPTRSHFTPYRSDVVEELDAGALLPAIYFIFSRKGCEDAMLQCLRSGLRLTKPSERDEIKRVLAERTSDLPDEDLGVLGYHDFAEALSRGIAAHHAGMLAAFKEVVEELFARGLIKVVFATETLALGINMPARTVVLEKLGKWNGEAHVDITPGEYTQLTGRAGRRGIDVEGHAVVLWQPGFDPRAVAGLASTRTYPLRSSFSPSYNMAVNLVRQVGRSRARDMLELSFAQFQSDQAVVGLARQVQRNTEALEGYKESIDCHLGDFLEYAALRRRIGDRESSGSKRRKLDRRVEAQESLEKLRIGDIIRIPAGRSAGWALVLDAGVRSEREGPRPTVLTLDRQVRKLSMIDFPTPVEAISTLRVPKKFNAAQPAAAPRAGARPARSHRHDRRGRPAVVAQPQRRCRHARGRPGAAADAGRVARASLPRLLGSRGPRPLGRAVLPAGPGEPRRPAQDRAADEHDRPSVRPGLPGARRAALPGRRQDHRGRRPAVADLHRARPGRGRVPAPGRVRRPRRTGAGGLPGRAGVRVAVQGRADLTAVAARRGADALERMGVDLAGPVGARAGHARRLPPPDGSRLLLGRVPLGLGRLARRGALRVRPGRR